MSERNGYEPGVPCWVAAVHEEPERAVDFYSGLFGWEVKGSTPADGDGQVFLCSLRGSDVAAIVSPAPGAPAPAGPSWDTYVWVESADDTAAAVVAAGGNVVGAPFDAQDGGRMAVLADSTGAVFCVWQTGEHNGAQRVNEPGAWAMSQLSTPDLEAAKAFYATVFGWDYDGFDVGGAQVALCRLPGYVGGEPQQPVPRDVVAVMAPMGDGGPEGTPPHWSADFWVADVDAAANRAAELGGTVIAPPFDTPVGRTAVIADPPGAVLSISQVSTGGRA